MDAKVLKERITKTEEKINKINSKISKLESSKTIQGYIKEEYYIYCSNSMNEKLIKKS